jgi:hypothetical protein
MEEMEEVYFTKKEVARILEIPIKSLKVLIKLKILMPDKYDNKGRPLFKIDTIVQYIDIRIKMSKKKGLEGFS